MYDPAASRSLANYIGSHRELSLTAVKKFLHEGADPNAHADVGPMGGRGVSLLMKATWQPGNESIVRELVRAGARVDTQDCHGNTALLHAASHGTVHNVIFLLAEGANINHQEQHGETALIKAIMHSEVEVVRELLLHRADTEIQTTYGLDAVTMAKTDTQGNGPILTAMIAGSLSDSSSNTQFHV
jgi:ankyrin repeat protein